VKVVRLLATGLTVTAVAGELARQWGVDPARAELDAERFAGELYRQLQPAAAR
jgi:hypothetical protein